MKNTLFVNTIAALLMAACATATAEAQQKKNVTVHDFCSSEDLYAEWPQYMQPTADGEHYTTLEEWVRIEKHNFRTGKVVETLMDLGTIENCPISYIEGYELSPTETHILLYANSEPIYRRSFSADYYIYDIKYKTLTPLSKDGGEQAAEFAPNGAMVAFVRDNNIYVYKLKYNSESAVTTDGKRNEIINGIPDWVYEEEFAMHTAMQWSPDSKEIAYIRFDETEVPTFSFPVYNKEGDALTAYPSAYTYKYPKAGEKNSTVSVHVFNIDNRTTKKMDIADDGEFYIPRIIWTKNERQLAVVKLNRRQNRLDLTLYNTASTVGNTIFTDKNDRYVDENVLDNIIFLHGGQHFVYLGIENGYRHISLYGINGVKRAQLTKGDFDVTNIAGYDPASRTIIYEAAATSPLERDIYTIDIDGKKPMRLTQGGGTYNVYTFKSGSKYFVQSFSNTDTPPVFTVCDLKGQAVRTVEDNSRLKSTIAQYNVMPKEFFTFNTPDGVLLNGWIIKPANFDPAKKYPVLMVQYSGPSSQEVLNVWAGLGWEQTLCSEGYVVACVDPRGTGARGEDFTKCTYMKLGKIESDDQISAAKYLASLSYIDPERIGIWGWSFGGFISSLCICKDDIFKMAISIAPVINWRLYDTVYTERYMRTPQENPSGYDDNSPINHAKNLKGRLFLIHGTADDNVHFQNQMDFVSELVKHGKQFDMFTYPDRNHNIYGGNTRNHLFTMLLQYVKSNL